MSRGHIARLFLVVVGTYLTAIGWAAPTESYDYLLGKRVQPYLQSVEKAELEDLSPKPEMGLAVIIVEGSSWSITIGAPDTVSPLQLAECLETWKKDRSRLGSVQYSKEEGGISAARYSEPHDRGYGLYRSPNIPIAEVLSRVKAVFNQPIKIVLVVRGHGDVYFFPPRQPIENFDSRIWFITPYRSPPSDLIVYRSVPQWLPLTMTGTLLIVTMSGLSLLVCFFQRLVGRAGHQPSVSLSVFCIACLLLLTSRLWPQAWGILLEMSTLGTEALAAILSILIFMPILVTRTKAWLRGSVEFRDLTESQREEAVNLVRRSDGAIRVFFVAMIFPPITKMLSVKRGHETIGFVVLTVTAIALVVHMMYQLSLGRSEEESSRNVY